MKKTRLLVKTKSKKYPIIIGPNIINDVNNILKFSKIYFEKVLIIYDTNVPKNKLFILKQKIKSSKKIIHNFKASEKNKNLKSINSILNKLFKFKFNRNDCIISLGGGIAGDVSGFAASIYKRGIKFINIPTTLLAQVDSSIGGKTGINNSYGKNLLGSFYQPNLVISDTDLLKSLNSREIICGYAEILKSSLLDSIKKFKYLDNNLNSILKLKQPFIENAILNSCNLKKMVVQKDEDEKNLRKILNLGHTFAHAFESCLGFSSKLNHGEAVIIGITIALEFSYQRRLIKNKTYNFIKKHLERIPLKKKFTSIFNKKDVSKIISFMKSDKKNTTKKINIILIKDFGKIKTNYQFDQNTLKQFLISELKK